MVREQIVSQELSGGIALVTGGSSGIGRAAALAFAAEGAKVVIASRREANSLETVRLVKEAGGEAFFVRADVSRSSEVQQMVARTVERYGGLNYAFNNAGIEGRPICTSSRSYRNYLGRRHHDEPNRSLPLHER